MRLFVGEGEHAMQMRVGVVLGLDELADAQHFGGIAAIEGEVLVELDRGEVARVLAHDLVADPERRRHVIGHPALKLAEEQRLARIGGA